MNIKDLKYSGNTLLNVGEQIHLEKVSEKNVWAWNIRLNIY